MRPASLRALALAVGILTLAACAGRRPLDPRTAVYPPPRLPEIEVQGGRLAPGGAEWFWVEDHDVPLIRLYLAVRGGEVYDPPELAGLARVASLAWRTGGAGDLDPEAFDRALENRGMDLSVHLGRDKGWITLTVLPEDLDRGLDLLAKLLWEPALRADRVDWAKAQVAEALRREADEPQSLGFREMRRALFRGHPRGRVPTEETVGRIGRDDLVEIHRRLVSEGTWALGAVGDFEPEDLRERLAARFGRLPGRGGAFPLLTPPAEPQPTVVIVPKALPQTTVIWARIGPARLSEDFAALEVCDHVLGSGGFTARLVREIRSNRGLAYSVGSFYQALPRFGVLGAYGLTKTQSAGEVVDLMRAEIRNLADGITAAEVEEARRSLVTRHVFRYDDPANLVRDRLENLLDGLPLDLGERYPDEVAAVTLDAARRAARSHLDPARGVWVLVGDLDPADPRWGRMGAVEVVKPGE
ncbi:MULTISPECIES: M16 family metallopeptidase [Deferrisoma]